MATSVEQNVEQLKREIASLKEILSRESRLRKIKYFDRLDNKDEYWHCEFYFPEYCDYCLEQKYRVLNLCFRCYRHICRSCLETEKHGYCQSFERAYFDTYFDENDPERTEIPVDSYLCEL